MNALRNRPAVDSVTALPAASAETCDRCGPSAQALVQVNLPDGSKLTFCGHDAAELGLGPEVITALVLS
jgi:hypothetical protein